MAGFVVNDVIRIGNLSIQIYPRHKKSLQCISVPVFPHYISGPSETPKLRWHTYIDGGIRSFPRTIKTAHGLIPSLSTLKRVLCCNPFINPPPPPPPAPFSNDAVKRTGLLMLILRAICLPHNPTLPFSLITIFQSLPFTPNLIPPPTSLILFPMKFRIWFWRFVLFRVLNDALFMSKPMSITIEV
jgi:hypothetical protein